MRTTPAVLLATLLLTALLRAEDPKKPPEGWKEYAAKGNSFSVWLPEDAGKKTEKFKDVVAEKGMNLRISLLSVPSKAGLTLEAATVTISPYGGEIAKLKSATRVDILRDLFVAESKGKASDEKEIQQGRVPGREFVVQVEDGAHRYRVYAFADRFFFVVVKGTKKQVESKEADTFLDSYKIPERYAGPPEKEKDKDK
jgi:hypothetical protein